MIADGPAAGDADPAALRGDGYLGFWKRVLASLIDNVIVAILLAPLGSLLLSLFHAQAQGLPELGEFDDLADVAAKLAPANGSIQVMAIESLVTALAFILLWRYLGTTPGKMVFQARVVDARTFEKPSLGQSTLRYLGYIPAILLFMGGFIMVAFDRQKRGLHDVIAGTLVVVPGRAGAVPQAAA